MRKVTKETVSAFLAGERRTVGNTMTDGESLFLHGNRIAWKNDAGDIRVSMCGWGTPTTRERLNGVALFATGHQLFSQYRHEQYMGDDVIHEDGTYTIPWNGQWTVPAWC